MALKQLEEIESQALKLLLSELETERPGLLRWAAGELERVGVPARLSSDQPHQGVHDLIGSNLALPDWMVAREVHLDNVLQAENFRDLIDRLTPATADS